MAIEHLLEYEDIMLIPSPTNNGIPNNLNLYVTDSMDTTGVGSISLPIFNSPMEGIIDENNWKIWSDNGIKPILPRTVPLNVREEACLSIWCAFSASEVESLFLKKDKRNLPSQFHICIDCGNGHDLKMIKLGFDLKSLYKNQVVLMGGNIANPDGYQHYVRAGFDYVRVGIASGSLVDKDHFGFHYPQASLLMEIEKSRKMMQAQGHHCTKVIADGGITCYSDILKAISLGADYVMVGREFIQLVEASGSIYKESKDPQTSKKYMEEFTEADYETLLPEDLTKKKCFRAYHGNTSPEIQAIRAGFGSVGTWQKNKPEDKVKTGDANWEWIRVTNFLEDWIRNFKEIATFGFMMSDANNWESFKSKSKYVAI